jgi:pyruvate kinase
MTSHGGLLFCTLGPSSLKPRVIKRLDALGVGMFRINLSHTSIDDLASVVALVQSHSNVPICLDSEGAQVRTGKFAAKFTRLRKGGVVEACPCPVIGDSARFNFTPAKVVELLRVGDLITIDFHEVIAEVVESRSDRVLLQVLKSGRVGSNKACSVNRDIDLPAISPKDREAIRIGHEMSVNHFALSFAAASKDVQLVRELIGPDGFLVSKIESRRGISNLDEIACYSDAILIDRGDLSREVPPEQIPAHQKDIIRRVKKIGRPVFVATNLVESMVKSRVPTLAEVNDIYNTLADGADGLVLAAETAVGRFPVECASFVMRVIAEFERG